MPMPRAVNSSSNCVTEGDISPSPGTTTAHSKFSRNSRELMRHASSEGGVVAPLELRPPFGWAIVQSDREVVRLTEGQLHTLNLLRGVRRGTVVGGAGTGKTMLAVAKASQLADEGFQTLLVCFNSPIAGVLADDTKAVSERTGRLDVTTLHQLAEALGRAAGTLPPKPDPVIPEWFAETLPGCLDDAIGVLGPRYQAIVVDEGQDFDSAWVVSLEGLLHGGHDDVLYVFHDPAQAIVRDDQTADLGLEEIALANSNTYAVCKEFALRAKKLMDLGTQPGRLKVRVFGDATGDSRKSSASKTDWSIDRPLIRSRSSRPLRSLRSLRSF
jgi:hypothetical protein